MNKITRLANVELRALADNEQKVEGIACVFDTETDLGYFYEKIDRHAFDECDMSDVYCLFNHDSNYPLARTLNGSLELSVEDKGLHQVADIIGTSQGNDIFKMVRENLIDKMSFAFTIDSDHGEEWYLDEDGKEHRTIKKINKLFDVSLVTYPAYSSTSAFARSVDELDELAKEHLKGKEEMLEEKRTEEVVETTEEIKEEANEEVREEVVVEETTTDEVKEEVEEVRNEESTKEEENVQVKGEERQMNTNFEKVEARSEDIKSWRNYVMNGMVEERAGLKSTDAGVPVPTIFQSYIETAWDKVDLLDEVTKSTIKGIFKVSHEVSATEAGYHVEGAAAPTEESLVLATTSLIPMMIKKWISVTDELQAMTDDEFMRYVADEVVYQVLKALQSKMLVGVGQGSGSNEGVVGIASASLTESITSALTFNFGNEALAVVDGGDSPLVVMNRETFFKNVMGLMDTAGRPIYNIAMDNAGKPQYFVNGLRVKFNASIPAYDTAEAGQPWAIVGDFKAYRLNMPMGENVATLFDPYTLATEDKARMIGKIFAAGNVVRAKALAKLVKPEA